MSVYYNSKIWKAKTVEPSRRARRFSVSRFRARMLPAVALLKSSASAAGARSARLHRASLGNADCSAVHILAVPHLNRLGRFVVIRHFDESEALGAASHFISDDSGGSNCSGFGEMVAQNRISYRVGKISYVEFLCHFVFLSC